MVMSTYWLGIFTSMEHAVNAKHLSSTLIAAGLMALAATSAHAGSVSSIQTRLGVVIQDASGAQWDLSLELAQFLAPDLAQGTVTLQAPTSAIADADGVWTPNTTATVNGQTVTGLGWHSWLKTDGSSNTVADPAAPWAASLIVTHLGGLIDPSMDYGFYIQNNTAGAQTYTVTYGQSIEPTVQGAYTIEAHIAGALSNTDGAATLTPAGTATLIQQVQLSSDGGQTFVNAGVDVGPAATVSGYAGTYGPYSAQASGVAPSAGFNHWGFVTSFTLSGNKDVFVASGSATITPVPEPSTWLLALGAVGVFVGLRGRQTASAA